MDDDRSFKSTTQKNEEKPHTDIQISPKKVSKPVT